jgi:hypothetical protein
MTRAHRLRLEQLEDRVTPATFGFPWPNASHLTVSFAPDGTAVGSSPSQLFGLFAARHIAADVWQGEVLRALQTWAASANINFSVVTDDGEPLGTPGALEGDPRFGDLRIAAAPLSPGNVTPTTLSSESVSASVPFDPAAGTWSGDLLFNSNFTFGVGDPNAYDVYSIALHEVGHILGLDGNLTDRSSVLFEYYNGIRTGLSASDVAAVQQLYGARQADRFEGWRGNNTFDTATGLRRAALVQYQTDLSGFEQAGDVTGVLPFSVRADLTTPHDVDVFQFRTSGKLPDFTVNLQTTGVSLLQSRLTVYDDEGHVVASIVAADLLHGDLSVRVSHAAAHDRYFIKVEHGRNDVFGIGAYRLQVVPDNPRVLASLDRALRNFPHHAKTNDTLGAATPLVPAAQSAPGHEDFYAEGNLAGAADVDFYRLRAPTTRGGKSESMTVLVWMKNGTGLTPGVTVYDAYGRQVAAEVVVADNGLTAVRVTAARPGALYFVAVRPVNYPPSTVQVDGCYALAVEFGAPTEVAPVVASGTLSSSPDSTSQQNFRSVVLPQGEAVQLTISADTPGATVETAMEVTLFDQSGNIVFDQVLTSGQKLQKTLFLAQGSYTFRFVGGTKDGSPLPPMNYLITGLALSEPIGPKLIDPSVPPPPREVIPTWLDNGLLVIYSLFDPYGRPLLVVE